MQLKGNNNMGREEQIISERMRKIIELRKAGIEPYPNRYDKTHSSSQITEEFGKLKNEEKAKKNVKVAGRVMVIRDMGKIIFAQIQDYSGKIQAVMQEKETPEREIEFFKKYIDSGDFIGVEGMPVRTKRGEMSVLASKVTLLTKSILPLPEKWSGLQDKEERYRRRYLDLVMNPEVMQVFDKRSRILRLLRDFLDERGFIEIDTPMIQPLYGGGAAKPFISELNALKMRVYLAISHELYIKRLIVGGFEKLYVMNRVFRNEGVDATHNPEFTILETMWGYMDYRANMNLFEEMVEYVAKKLLGTTKINYQGTEIELRRPWKRMTMYEAIKKHAGIDVDKMSDKELMEFIDDKNIRLKTEFRRGLAIEEIFSELAQKNLIQPTIIYDYPADTSPLAKQKPGNEDICERFEPFINGWELGNNYSEMNDPIRLKEVLMEQTEFMKRGDEEAAPYDEDFVRALEIGMPPTSGLGLGVDRLIMLLTNQPSIRDIIFFPFMKPENYKEDKKTDKIPAKKGSKGGKNG